MSEFEIKIPAIRKINENALDSAIRAHYRESYQDFMKANDMYEALDKNNPDVVMAGSDTLRDWGMTYAREASEIEILDDLPEEDRLGRVQERQLLFDAAEQVIERAKQIATPLVTESARYANKRQVRRGYNTFWVAESVATRARTLRKTTIGEVWGDDPGYGAAYAGLKPSYWAVTAAAQPLRYIRAKEHIPDENITNSKSSLLHMIPLIGRTATTLLKTTFTPYESRHDKVRAWGHVARIVRSLGSPATAHESIRQRP